MVQITSTLLLSLLAVSAEAHRRFEHRGYRHPHHKRQYYSGPDSSSSSSGSSSAPSGAPYPIGNATSTAGGGLGTVTQLTTYSTTTSIVTQVVTVLPVGSGSAYPTTGAGAGVTAAGGDQCAPVTVTVTGQAVTVTVTPSNTGAGAAPSSYAAPLNTTASAAAAAASTTSSTPAAAPSTTSAVYQAPPPVYTSSAPAAPSTSAAAGAGSPPSSSAAAGSGAAPSPYQAKQYAPPASSSAAAPASSAVSSGSNSPAPGGKRGVGYNDASLLSGFKSTDVTWAYNWGMDTPNIPITFIPTLRDASGLGNFQSKCDQAVAAGAPALFTFNEPDMTTGAGGSQMSPQEAAGHYKTAVNPYAGKLKLGAPSVTSHNATTGAAGFSSGMYWLTDFAKACDGQCHIDFVNLHFYGGSQDSGSQTAEIFKKYVGDAIVQVEQIFGSKIPVWVTEFSATPTADQGGAAKNAEFLSPQNGVLDFLDQNCEKYAFYMASANNLVTGSGSLTDLGKSYSG